MQLTLNTLDRPTTNKLVSLLMQRDIRILCNYAFTTTNGADITIFSPNTIEGIRQLLIYHKLTKVTIIHDGNFIRVWETI